MNIGIVIFYRYITVNGCQSAAIFKPCIFFNHDVIKVHLVINRCNIGFYCPQFRKYGFIVSVNLINYQRFNRAAAAIGIGIDNQIAVCFRILGNILPMDSVAVKRYAVFGKNVFKLLFNCLHDNIFTVNSIAVNYTVNCNKLNSFISIYSTVIVNIFSSIKVNVPACINNSIINDIIACTETNISTCIYSAYVVYIIACVEVNICACIYSSFIGNIIICIKGNVFIGI